MRMTPAVLILGGLLIFAPVLFMFVVLPWLTMSEKGSDIFRPRTELEDEGRSVYVNNGCTYCHTQFIRNFDWDIGADRIAQEGDYVADSPHLIGTERTGPDLSQEGGEHPNDWHLHTSPIRGSPAPSHLCPPGSFSARKKSRPLRPTSRVLDSNWLMEEWHGRITGKPNR